MKRLLAISMVLALVGSISQAASRTWKSSNGRFSVEAELLDFKDGKAQLKKSDGAVIEVPLVSLCDEDRLYVKSQFPGVEEEKLTPGAEYREWKSKNGKFSTLAEFLGYADGKVQLRKPDGSEISVDKKLLSEADQRWIAAELQRLGEEEKEEQNGRQVRPTRKSAAKSSEQEIAMKLMRLDPPKAKGRSKATRRSAYLFSLITPQQIYVQARPRRRRQGGRVPSRRQQGTQVQLRNADPRRRQIRLPRNTASPSIRPADKVAGLQPAVFRSQRQRRSDGRQADRRDHGERPGPAMSQSQFPRVDIVMEVDGKQIEYFVSAERHLPPVARRGLRHRDVLLGGGPGRVHHAREETHQAAAAGSQQQRAV